MQTSTVTVSSQADEQSHDLQTNNVNICSYNCRVYLQPTASSPCVSGRSNKPILIADVYPQVITTAKKKGNMILGQYELCRNTNRHGQSTGCCTIIRDAFRGLHFYNNSQLTTFYYSFVLV